MLSSPMKVLDTSVISEIRAFPQTELLRRLFPSMKVKERGAMSSPFREDRNPSYSCFIGHGGIWKGKDFSTGEVYDNIALYRALHSELAFPEAIDDLSRIILGRTAYRGMEREEYHRAIPARGLKVVRKPQADRESSLRVLSVSPILSGTTPGFLKDYWRGRCISDANIASTCVYAVFETDSLKGKVLADGISGLPVLDGTGNPVRDDGIRDAVGFYNDIGGLVFRTPETSVHKGFKGGTSSFVSTLLPDGGRPSNAVFFKGQGTGVMEKIEYNPRTFAIEVNGSQFFWPVAPEIYPFTVPFLQEWKGSVLDEREVKGLCAVLTCMNSPHCGRAVVVEGMFDALSYMELRGAGNGFVPGCDLIVLNSINNIRWAVPNLCLEREIVMIYDNDIRTKAGNKSFEKMRELLKEYSSACGVRTPALKSGEGYLAGSKDLNDALVKMMRCRIEKKNSKSIKSYSYGNQQKKKAEPAGRGVRDDRSKGIR